MLRRLSFLLMIFLGVFANFIANDKPIVICYKSSLYFPIIFDYSGKVFGLKNTIIDYKKQSFKTHINKNGWEVFPPIQFNASSINYESGTLSFPTKENILGTDDQGRDIAARLIYSYRNTAIFVLFFVPLTILIGLFVGAAQAFFGGITDMILQRIIEVLSSISVFVILLILSSSFPFSNLLPIFVFSLFKWPKISLITRADLLKTISSNYVKASKMFGSSNFFIIKNHIMLGSMTNIISYVPFMIIEAIMTLTALEYLGFNTYSPSLGEFFSQARNNAHHHWLLFISIIAIVIPVSTLSNVFIPKKYFKKTKNLLQG